jgi:hypothetical protein
MDLIIGQVFFQRKVVHINKSVWEIVKHIGSLLEAKDDDFDNDIFYTLPSSPSKLIFVKLENFLDVNRGKRHSWVQTC